MRSRRMRRALTEKLKTQIVGHRGKKCKVQNAKYKMPKNEKNEYVMSKQLLRCNTSIGANVAEAQKDKHMKKLFIKPTSILHFAFYVLLFCRLYGG